MSSKISPITPGHLTIATYAGFAPFSWREGDIARGRDHEFLRGMAANLGLAFIAQFYQFDGLWERPAHDEADIAAAGISVLAERATPGMVWSDPYFAVQRCLVIRKADQARYKTIADFAECTIEVTPGSAADIDVAQRKPASARLTYCHNLEDALHRLLERRIDAFGTGDHSGKTFLARFPQQVSMIDVHPMPLGEPFAFAVRAASNLITPLNAYIQANREHY